MLRACTRAWPQHAAGLSALFFKWFLGHLCSQDPVLWEFPRLRAPRWGYDEGSQLS